MLFGCNDSMSCVVEFSRQLVYTKDILTLSYNRSHRETQSVQSILSSSAVFNGTLKTWSFKAGVFFK